MDCIVPGGRKESGTTEQLLLPLARPRELSELQLRKGDLCSSQLGGNLTFWPRIAFRKASRSSAKNSRWLWDPYPKTSPDSHHLRTNISFLVSEYSLVAFFLISPWLFLSPRTLCFNSISFSQTVVLKTLNKLCSYLQPSAFFYWRIIALQSFSGFCHTSARVSHRYTNVSSLKSPPPISHSIAPL